jgi:hypothetical protein
MARFMRKGITKVYFVPTIATPAAPTAVEITAGTSLTGQIAEINGFTFTNSPIDVPDMSSAFVKKIPGEDSVEDSNMSFYEDKTSNPIRTALSKGTSGYIVIFPAGTAGATPAAADKAEVWGCIIASSSRKYTAGNEAAQYQVVFTLTDPPVDATVV